MIDPQIVRYVEEQILPWYARFDKAHDLRHVQKVIGDSLQIAADHPVNVNMVYVIAAYHDVGLQAGRENHEKNSGALLAEDEALKEWFTAEEIRIMKEAVEDHRASNGYEPRSLYGKIVAEADREIGYEILLYRTLQYGLKHFPHYTPDQHFERAYDHISKKYGEDGYITLWLNTKKNSDGLSEIRSALRSKETMRADFMRMFFEYEGGTAGE